MKSKRSEFFVQHHFTNCLLTARGEGQQGTQRDHDTNPQGAGTSTIPMIVEQGSSSWLLRAIQISWAKLLPLDNRSLVQNGGESCIASQGTGVESSQRRAYEDFRYPGKLKCNYVLCLRPNNSPHEYHMDPKLMGSQVAHHLLRNSMAWRSGVPHEDILRVLLYEVLPQSALQRPEQHPAEPSPTDEGAHENLLDGVPDSV